METFGTQTDLTLFLVTSSCLRKMTIKVKEYHLSRLRAFFFVVVVKILTVMRIKNGQKLFKVKKMLANMNYETLQGI